MRSPSRTTLASAKASPTGPSLGWTALIRGFVPTTDRSHLQQIAERCVLGEEGAPRAEQARHQPELELLRLGRRGRPVDRLRHLPEGLRRSVGGRRSRGRRAEVREQLHQRLGAAPGGPGSVGAGHPRGAGLPRLGRLCWTAALQDARLVDEERFGEQGFHLLAVPLDAEATVGQGGQGGGLDPAGGLRRGEQPEDGLAGLRVAPREPSARRAPNFTSSAMSSRKGRTSAPMRGSSSDSTAPRSTSFFSGSRV